jgi:hypothetical protein
VELLGKQLDMSPELSRGIRDRIQIFGVLKNIRHYLKHRDWMRGPGVGVGE